MLVLVGLVVFSCRVPNSLMDFVLHAIEELPTPHQEERIRKYIFMASLSLWF